MAGLATAASMAALEADGIAEVAEVRGSLCEDVSLAGVLLADMRVRSSATDKQFANRIDMMRYTAEFLKQVQAELTTPEYEASTRLATDNGAAAPRVEGMAAPLAIWALEHWDKKVELCNGNGHKVRYWSTSGLRVKKQEPPAGSLGDIVSLWLVPFPDGLPNRG